MNGLVAISGLGGCGCARPQGGLGRAVGTTGTSSYPVASYVAGGILVLAFGLVLWGDSKVPRRAR